MLDNFLVTNGYQRSPTDECIYVKTVKREDGFISFVILTVYVYDIIPVSNDVKMLKAEEESLCKEFEMVIWDKFTLSLESQSKETKLLRH